MSKDLVMCSACDCCSIGTDGLCSGRCDVDHHQKDDWCLYCEADGYLIGPGEDGRLMQWACTDCEGTGKRLHARLRSAPK